MIWDSVLIMTLLDLAIVAMAGAMLFMAKRKGLLGRRSPAVMCLVAGMSIVGIFYLTDLLFMHIGPALLGDELPDLIVPHRLVEFALRLNLQQLEWS